jgi:hypothetical protein
MYASTRNPSLSGIIGVMGNTIKGPQPRDRKLSWRTTASIENQIDKNRGGRSRTEYLDSLVVRDTQNRKEQTNGR